MMEAYEDVESNLRPVRVGQRIVGFVELEPEEYEPRPEWMDDAGHRGVET